MLPIRKVSWWLVAFTVLCLVFSEHVSLLLVRGPEFQTDRDGIAKGYRALQEEILEGEEGSLEKEARLDPPEDSLSLILSELAFLPYHPELVEGLFRPPRAESPASLFARI